MTRIVVRLPNWLGDAIMATPMLRALRACEPDARIDVVGRPMLRSLLEGLPYFDAFVPYERGFAGGLRLARTLRGAGYDVALVCPHSFGAAWPLAAAGIGRRVGYTKYPGRRWLLTDPLPVAFDTAGRFVPVAMHHLYLGLVRALGGPGDADPWPELPLASAAVAEVESVRARHGFADRPYIVVNPGAHFGASKLWTPRGFATVADRLARTTGAAIVIVGGPGEADIGRAVQELMEEPAVDLCAQPLTLPVLYALIAQCTLLVTVDSGPRHMAVAARRPVVTIMGPTDPRYTNACIDQTIVVRLAELHCIACHFKTCPGAHECMELLPPDRVYDAAMALWENGS